MTAVKSDRMKAAKRLNCTTVTIGRHLKRLEKAGKCRFPTKKEYADSISDAAILETYGQTESLAKTADHFQVSISYVWKRLGALGKIERQRGRML